MKKELAIETTFDQPWFSLDYTFNKICNNDHITGQKNCILGMPCNKVACDAKRSVSYAHCTIMMQMMAKRSLVTIYNDVAYAGQES